MAPVDAQTLWMSTKIANDQFLLYAFDGAPPDTERVIAGIRQRAQQCPDLMLRVEDDSAVRYPAWVPAAVSATQFVRHDPPEQSWTDCLDAIARLTGDQLDLGEKGWRLHIFERVRAVPRTSRPATVTVLQIAHALADGTRTDGTAAWLFGRDAPMQPVPAPSRGWLLPRAVRASRAQHRLERDIAAGLVAGPTQARPALLSNTRPAGVPMVRTLVCDRARLGGPTVTIAALVAISTALAGMLRERGADPAQLGAEVLMAKPGVRHSHNHFRNVGIGLYPDLERGERARRITEVFAAQRDRARHPAMTAAALAFAAVPAPLLRWGVAQFDPDARSTTVTGNTVVSSVNRGVADLRFGAAAAVFTAGFPALSPMMGLTHGVHGLGDAIAISVHTAPSVFDATAVADYLARLDHALGA